MSKRIKNSTFDLIKKAALKSINTVFILSPNLEFLGK